MPRGGYHGGGRPKGSKDKAPRKGSSEQVEAKKVKELLATGVEAKKKIFHEFLIRVANVNKKQIPLSITEKKMMNQLSVELAEELSDKSIPALPEVLEELAPLQHMLRIMNDPKEDPVVRRQMAIAAAPYIHPRAGESGKKEIKEDKASTASKGKFAAGRSPLALVK